MKKILAIVGSPRIGGNTDILIQKVAEGATSKGAKVNMLHLGKVNIRECDGCHICWQGKSCSKRDDMLDICSAIIENDVIVFGTPVYWYGPTALMKSLIDRFVYFNCSVNRAKISGKKAAIVIPFEEENPETAKPVVEFFVKCLNYLEMRLFHAIIVGGVSDKGDVLNKTERLSEAFELGKKLGEI
jgi:multimeric flavodoxin WrbA